ncbi:MAG: GHKL domain-containing protein [Oscillospiraceae bacterium]|nr:GHKL domain-containing protein [Oscillospiraceae bacterium]
MSNTVMFFAISLMQLFLFAFQWSEICRCKFTLPVFTALLFLINSVMEATALFVLHIPHGNVAFSLVQTAVLFTVMWFSFKGTLHEKLRLILISVFLSLLMELLSILLAMLVYGKRYYEFQELNENLSVMQLYSIDIMQICTGIMAFFINRKQEGFREVQQYLAMIPLFAVIHLVYLILYYKSGERLVNQSLAIQLMLQVLMSFLLIGFYRLVKQHLARYQSEERLRQIESSMQSTHEYYRLAHEKFDEIARIRHDFRNQMQTVERLLADGHTAEARENASLIQGALDDTRLPSYCPDPVVDALLTVKLNEPDNRRIHTEILLRDTEQHPLNPYEACSLFSNLIDNAFAAAREEGLSAPFVRVRSGVRNGIFLLKVENSYKPDAPPKDRDNAAHGYGLQIIETIARRHNGSFRITQEEQTVTALVAVPTRKP